MAVNDKVDKIVICRDFCIAKIYRKPHKRFFAKMSFLYSFKKIE